MKSTAKNILFMCLGGLIFLLIYYVPSFIDKNLGITREGKIAYMSEGKFKIQEDLATPYPHVEDHPLVVIIAAYNNAAYVKKTLSSVLHQNYDNFRLIYIDDASTDGAFDIAKDYIKKKGFENRSILIQNQKKDVKCANLFRAFQMCKDHEIVVLCDGDDVLASEDVLKKINACYQNPAVWVTYGNSLISPHYLETRGKPIPDHVIAKNSIRRASFFEISKPQTFYASLAKKIKLSSLLYQNNFFAACDDAAIMYPIVEMAGKHVLFIKDFLYIENDLNPLRERVKIPTLQYKMYRFIKKQMDPYLPLPDSFNPKKMPSFHAKQISSIIFSDNTPSYLKLCLETNLPKMENISRVTVFYEADNEIIQDAYLAVQKEFPAIEFQPVQGQLRKHLLDYFALNYEDQFITILSDRYLHTRSPSLFTVGLEELSHYQEGICFLTTNYPLDQQLSLSYEKKLNALPLISLLKQNELDHLSYAMNVYVPIFKNMVSAFPECTIHDFFLSLASAKEIQNHGALVQTIEGGEHLEYIELDSKKEELARGLLEGKPIEMNNFAKSSP